MKWFMKLSFLQMMVLGHNILVLKILMTNPTLARALSTDFNSLRSINLSRGLVIDGILEDTEIEKFFGASTNL